MDAAMKFKLRLTERKGQNYFTVEKNAFKGRVDRAHVKLTALKAEQQPMGNFYFFYIFNNYDLPTRVVLLSK